MSNTHPDNIPDEILKASRTLRDYATMNGWGGHTGCGVWAIEGIGIIDPFYNRIYELERRVRHLEQAWINSDRLNTTYQLQLEALTLASNRVATHCRYGNHQKIFQTLVELLHDQNEANKL